MSDQRFSTNLLVTAQDFAECGWKSSLGDEVREGYSSMWQAFSSPSQSLGRRSPITRESTVVGVEA